MDKSIAIVCQSRYKGAMSKDLIQTQEYRDLITELAGKIRSAQIKAALKANEELLQLYWEIGRLIGDKQQNSGWGEDVIGQIAHDLSREFPAIKSFSRRNLFFMKQWHSFYVSQGEKVKQLVSQIP